MKYFPVSLIALCAAPSFVHGANHHSLTCEYWPEACDDDHDSEEERRTLLDAQFDAEKRPPRKLSKKNPPLPPRPIFCDEFKMFWNTTAFRENSLVQGSEPAQRGTKTCFPNTTFCRGDTAQSYFDLYAEPALTTKIGVYAETTLIVGTVPALQILSTGSMEVETPDFRGELLWSSLFGVRSEITAGSKSYLGATGTIETNTQPFTEAPVVGEFIVRCELTNPSNP